MYDNSANHRAKSARTARPQPGARRPRSAQRALVFFAVIWLAVGAAAFVAVLALHALTAKSTYTQSHGVRETAVVLNDHVNTGRTTTSDIAVRLSAPVDGHGTTTVNVLGATGYAPGTSLTALVDPQDPGYAELPGRPYSTASQWEAPAVLGFVDVFSFPFVVIYLRRRLVRQGRLPARR